MKQWVRTIPWLLVCAAVFAGFIRVENLVDDLNTEKSRAIYNECLSVQKSLKPLYDVIVFSTEPSAPSSDPDLQARIEDINKQKSLARFNILQLVPTIKCKLT